MSEQGMALMSESSKINYGTSSVPSQHILESVSDAEMITFTIGEALDALPVGRAHWLLVLHVAAVRFSISFADQLGPYIFPGVSAEWGLEANELGMIGTASSLGSLVGTSLSFLLDGQAGGRTVAMRWGSAAACATGLLMTVAPSFHALLVLRLIQSGANVLTDVGFNIWLQEHMPTSGRGSFYALAVLGWPFGKESMILIASLLHADHWRPILFCAAALIGLVSLSARLVDDSPRQLIANGTCPTQRSRAPSDPMLD